MPSLDHLLARVVERKGYTIQGADSEGLLARKGEESLLVAWKTDGALTVSDVLLFSTALEQTRATRGVMIAARGTEPAAREQAGQNKNLEIWAESRLVVEVGEAFVKDALEAREGHAPAAAPQPAPVAAAPTPGAPRNTAVSGAAPNASRPPQARFPSLIAQAASLTHGDNRGAAYYMASKPRAPPPAAASDAPLRYAWGGINASSVDPGVAQVRNGRRKSAPVIVPEHDDVELVSSPRASASAPAPAQPPARVHEDVEIITTPRRKPEPAPEPAPAAPAAAPAPAPTPAPAPAPASVAAPLVEKPHVVEHEHYEIVSTPRRKADAHPTQTE